MSKETNKIILIGFGNEFRGDDGIGPKLLDLIECDVKKIKTQEITFDLIEDIKDFNTVIFIDASIEGEPIKFDKVKRTPKLSPFTHILSLEELLIWAESLNKKRYDFYLLSIRGYNFDFSEHLSDKARLNLKKGRDFLLKFIKKP